MTPLRIIREKLVQEPEIIDLEAIGARLAYHQLAISIDNCFLSDCGDKWRCSISLIDGHSMEQVVGFGPSLRSAMLSAFKEMEKFIENNKWKGGLTYSHD
jgi:hypothetical protein